jgi:hypothetical protein
MERKEDQILECFMLKGKGVDWLAVVYLEQGLNLKAFFRTKISGQFFQIRFLSAADPQKLSEELSRQFFDAAERTGLNPVHVDFPGGVNAHAFIRRLREARQDWAIARERAQN